MDLGRLSSRQTLAGAMKTLLTVGYLIGLITVLSLNVYAVRRPDKLMPLPTLLSIWMKSRSTRLALGIIWWWLGWHFLYAPL